MTTPTALNGRGGSIVYRNGRPRPIRYWPRKPFNRIEYFTATTNWNAVSNCSMSTAAITTPEGNSETLVKVTASGANVNSFFDETFPVATAPGTKYSSIVFDIFVTKPTNSTTAGTGSGGVLLTLTLSVTSFGGANNIACAFECGYGWQRVELCSADFSTINGTATWTGSTFIGIRWKITGTTGHTHSAWIREISWI